MKFALINIKLALTLIIALHSGILTAVAQGVELEIDECGGLFGMLHPEFSRKMKRWDQVSKALDGIAWADTPFNFDYDESEKMTLRSELKRAFTPEPGDLGNIGVPTGSEQVIADELKRAGIIIDASYGEGYCGGGDISYFVVSKSSIIFDLSKSDGFSSYVSSTLEAYVSKSTLKGKKKERRTTISPLPPHTPRKTVTVYVPSEISRGPSYTGLWDKFDVVLSV